MGKTRTCGKTCHNARGAKCRCWCGGLFHGGAGDLSRSVFRSLFTLDVPTTEREFVRLVQQRDLFTDDPLVGDTWFQSWRARVDARAAHAPAHPRQKRKTA